MGFFSNLFKKKTYEEELKSQAEMISKSTEANNSSFSNYVNSGDFRFEIDDVFTITGRGTVVTGKVVSGSVSLNDIVYVNGIQTMVTGIEMFRKRLDTATMGDNAGILLQGITRDQVSRGMFITK